MNAVCLIVFLINVLYILHLDYEQLYCINYFKLTCVYFLTCVYIFLSQRNGKHILWDHLHHLQRFTQADSGLYIGRRLTYEHLNLTSFSKMKVNLGAQVGLRSTYSIIVPSMHKHNHV